jgi:hypothetical protein
MDKYLRRLVGIAVNKKNTVGWSRIEIGRVMFLHTPGPLGHCLISGSIVLGTTAYKRK